MAWAGRAGLAQLAIPLGARPLGARRATSGQAGLDAQGDGQRLEPGPAGRPGAARGGRCGPRARARTDTRVDSCIF